MMPSISVPLAGRESIVPPGLPPPQQAAPRWAPASMEPAPARGGTAAPWPRSGWPCVEWRSCRLSLLCSISYAEQRISLQVFIEGDDVVGPHPAWGADRKSLLGPLGELARGLVVAARKGRLGRGKIGVGVVVLAPIGHRQRRIGVAILRLLDERLAQQRDRLVRQFRVLVATSACASRIWIRAGSGAAPRRGATAGSPPSGVRLRTAPGP